MKVIELIAYLQTLDPNMKILQRICSDYEDMPLDIWEVKSNVIETKRQHHTGATKTLYEPLHGVYDFNIYKETLYRGEPKDILLYKGN